jgi:hypothetical protein
MLFPQQTQNNQDTPITSDMFGVPIDQTGQGLDSWENESSASGNPGQPDQSGQNAQSQSPQDNDAARYAYWQSQHDKLKNQYELLQQQNQELQQRLGTVEKTVSQPAEPEEEQFPDPPAAPQKPYSFSQQEAMSDPNSESARYLIQLAEYNNVMNQYNLLRSNWIEAKHKEELQKIYAKDTQRSQAEVQKAEVSQQINQVIAMVQQKYGADYETAVDFVNTMSDNSSITVDNLFELYKMRKGLTPEKDMNGRYAPAPNPQQQFNPWGVPVQPQGQPSQDFQQRQRAQSIPPIMGVHNAQSETPEDPMIAAFRQTIKNSNNQNIY